VHRRPAEGLRRCQAALNLCPRRCKGQNARLSSWPKRPMTCSISVRHDPRLSFGTPGPTDQRRTGLRSRTPFDAPSSATKDRIGRARQADPWPLARVTRLTRFCARRTIAAHLSFLSKETIMSGAGAVVLVHGGSSTAPAGRRLVVQLGGVCAVLPPCDLVAVGGGHAKQAGHVGLGKAAPLPRPLQGVRIGIGSRGRPHLALPLGRTCPRR
jgi:hypothetical protein